MYGVVLWSDPKCDRALIWCEDHGSLAFYNAQTKKNEKKPAFESGDLVRFKSRDTRDMRIAEELEVIATDEYPSLARELRQAGHSESAPSLAASMAAQGSNILPFTATPAMSKTAALTGQQKVAVR